ncbi:Protein of unknown function [Cotesia congregata]|uniref:Uncharacterized protein n=1 Tax=Cotesia congregata TaxID=51543 RepID=A0A8J2MW39_COTCN|nr:Protein of unknown function [Cotesia congregata]
MEDLLRLWNLSDLHETFCVNHITDIEILGEFLTQTTEESQKEIADGQNTQNCRMIPVIHVSSNDYTVDNIIPVEFINSKGNTTSVLEENTVSKSKKKKNSKFYNFDLKKVLSDHPIGKELLLITKNKEKTTLEAQWISYLCEIVVIDCLKKGLILQNEDIEELAVKIVEVFPSECTQTFYVPPVKKKDSLSQLSIVAKGKLTDKYRNILTLVRTLRKFGDTSSDSTEFDENTENNHQNSALESKQWLKHHRDAVNVLLHWKNSYELRRSDVLSNKYSSATDILNDWPILKESVCADLINTDFEKVYPQNVINLGDCWNETFIKLEKISKNKINPEHQGHLEILEQKSKDVPLLSRSILQLEIFLHLLTPKPRKRTKNASSTAELDKNIINKNTLESVYIHIKIPGDIDKVCAAKVSLKATAKTTIQPYLIVVGPNILDLKKIYVQVDSFRFEASSFAAGFDLLFKFYVLFKLAYPVETQHFCNPAITQSMAQDMIKDFQQLMTGVSAAILQNLKKEIPVEYHEFIEVCFESDIFDNFHSTWKCMQQLKASDNYIAPQQFKIGEINDNKTVGNTVVFTKKSCYGQMIPLRATLKKFLELPNVFQVVRNFISNESAKNNIGEEFGAERCFAEIKTEFNHLAKQGITIEVDGENHTIYFILIGLLGDNLALNSLLGFNECFESIHVKWTPFFHLMIENLIKYNYRK